MDGWMGELRDMRAEPAWKEREASSIDLEFMYRASKWTRNYSRSCIASRLYGLRNVILSIHCHLLPRGISLS